MSFHKCFLIFSEICPQYTSEIYKTSNQNNTVTRNSPLKLQTKLQTQPQTKALSQKCLSHLGPFIWNGFPDDVKLSNNVNTFQQKVKKSFLTLLRKKIKISLFSMGKLPASSPHCNHETITRTGIQLVLYFHVLVLLFFLSIDSKF